MKAIKLLIKTLECFEDALSLLDQQMSPSAVRESESSFKMPFSIIVSEGMMKDAAWGAVSSFNSKSIGSIESPGSFIVVAIDWDSSVFSESNVAHQSVVSLELPLAFDKSFGIKSFALSGVDGFLVLLIVKVAWESESQ